MNLRLNHRVKVLKRFRNKVKQIIILRNLLKHVRRKKIHKKSISFINPRVYKNIKRFKRTVKILIVLMNFMKRQQKIT